MKRQIDMREKNFSLKNNEKIENINAFSQNKLKILIVDDSIINQKVAGMLSNDLGYETDFAHNGFNALAKCTEQYLLILLDIGLPDISGFEVAKKIRLYEVSENLRKKVPIIAYSAFGEEIKAECLSAGFNDFLFKPICSEDLKRVIQRWL